MMKLAFISQQQNVSRYQEQGLLWGSSGLLKQQEEYDQMV